MEIFTDGGCHGNPGPGAWAFRILDDLGGVFVDSSGFAAMTTNNRMELQAVIEALSYLETRRLEGAVSMVTDSTYVQKGVTEWIHSWRRNGWLTAAKKPVKNRDLWQRLDALNHQIAPTWRWVRGHDGNEHNEACDRLVQEEIRRSADL